MSPDAPPDRPRPQQAKDALACILILALCLMTFSRAFGSDFVFDSLFIIKRDPRVTQFSADSLIRIFTENYWAGSSSSNLYRPVTTLLFNIQHNILGFTDKPAGYQLFNLLLHIFISTLAYKLLVRLGLRRGPALLATLWFALHPYCAEVIPNIVGLSDLLALLAIIGGTTLYLKTLDQSIPFAKGLLYLTSLGILGTLSKESAISLLGIIIWHGITLGNKQAKVLFTTCSGKIHFSRTIAAGTCAALILTTVLLPKAFFKEDQLDYDPSAVDNPLKDLNFAESRLNATAILGDNFINSLVPTTISADYSYPQIPLAPLPPKSSYDWITIIKAASVIALGICGLCWVKTKPTLSFSIATVFITALPTANIILLIGTIRADRLVYQSLIPAIVTIGLLLNELCKRVPAVAKTQQKLPPSAYPVMAGAALLPLSLLTNLRCTDWRTTKGFWEATYATAPVSFKSKGGLASAELPLTLEECNRNVRLTRESYIQIIEAKGYHIPKNRSAHEALGRALLDRAAFCINNPGKGDPAPDLQEAYGIWNSLLVQKMELANKFNQNQNNGKKRNRIKLSEEVTNLSEILRHQNRANEAIKLFEENLTQNPYTPSYYKFYARALVDAGQADAGVKMLCKALLLNPSNIALAKEAQYIWTHKSTPPYAKPFSSATPPADAPIMNINDGGLYEMGRQALSELANAMEKEGKDQDRQTLLRFARVKLSIKL